MNDRQQNSPPARKTDFSLSGLHLRSSEKDDGLMVRSGSPQEPVLPIRCSIHCDDVETLAVFAVCDELDAATRTELDAHLAQCPACAAVVSREARLQQAIASLDQPADSLDRSSLLLAQCRSELAESLDDKQARANRSSAWLSIFSPVAWWDGLRHTLIYHPAMSMTVLVVAGFLAGVAGQRLRVAPPQVALPGQPVMSASAAPHSSGPRKITDEQLRSAGSAHVQWVTPSGSRTPSVDVELMSPTPMSIVGAPDDADVQRALTFVLENSQRFDPGARLDSLDVLRTLAADPDVRRTLCAATRLDRDPAVRIKALGALQGFEQDPAVHDTLLDALESDTDSGVRVEAIRLLRSALQSGSGFGASSSSGAPDPQTADILRDRLHNDPSPAVRQQSAAALRALGGQ